MAVPPAMAVPAAAPGGGPAAPAGGRLLWLGRVVVDDRPRGEGAAGLAEDVAGLRDHALLDDDGVGLVAVDLGVTEHVDVHGHREGGVRVAEELLRGGGDEVRAERVGL